MNKYMLAVALMIFYSSITEGSLNLTGCREKTSQPKIAFAGWPFRVSCNEIFHWVDDYEYYTDIIPATTNVTCSLYNITDNSTLISSKDHDDYVYYFYHFYDDLHHDVTIDTTQNITLHLYVHIQDQDICFRANLEIDVRELPKTCEISNSNPLTTHKEQCYQRGTKGDIYYTDDDENILPLALNEGQHNFTDYWLKNCDTHDYWSTTKHLQFDKVSFNDIGTYTYVVEYDGMKNYLMNIDILVKEPSTAPTATSLLCDKTVPVLPGGDAVLDCTVDLGVFDSVADYTTTLQKIGDDDSIVEICKINGNTNVSDDKVSCGITADVVKPVCYSVPVDVGEVDTSSLQLQFIINELSSSEQGQYVVMFQRFQYNWTETIEVNIDTSKHTARTVLLAVLIPIGLLISLVILIYVFRTHIQLFYKRHVAPYDKVHHTNTTHFFYYVDESVDKSQLAPAVDGVTTFIKDKLRGNVYDEHKHGIAGNTKQQNLVNCLKTSERVIVFLTPEFMTQDWEIYKVYKTLQETLEYQKKLIFIKFPKTNASLKTLQPPKTRNALKQILKLSRVMGWKGNKLNNELKMKLELALPKLPKNYHSNDASANDNPVYENAV